MESIKELRKICQEQKTIGKNFALAKGYLLHRRFSIYLTKFFLVFFPSIKPNFISLLMVLASLSGFVFLIVYGGRYWLLGIFLFYFGFLLDRVDGEVARYKKLFPLRGVYLDEMYHAATPALLLFGIMYEPASKNIFAAALTGLTAYLILLNRYNRKSILAIYVKSKDKFEKGEIANYEGNFFIKKFFNFPIFKLASIVERLDVLMLAVFLILLLDRYQYAGNSARYYYLYVYFFLNLFYFIRRFFLNYFGGIDDGVKELIEKGY